MTIDHDEALKLANQTVDDTWECSLCYGARHPNGYMHSQAIRGNLVTPAAMHRVAAALVAVAAERDNVIALAADERNSLQGSLARADAENVRLRAVLARWEALGERHDIQPRPPGCNCDQEPGDSACPVHGEGESA